MKTESVSSPPPSHFRRLTSACRRICAARILAGLSVPALTIVPYHFLIKGIASRLDAPVFDYLFDIDAVMAIASVSLTFLRIM